MDEFNRRFDKVFREVEQHMGRTIRGMGAMGSCQAHGTWSPAVDVYETMEGLVVFVETAGTDPDSLSVTAGRDVITIKGERCLPCLKEMRSVHQLEIDQGRFNRAIRLPVPVDVNAVSSNFRNGILEITLPREQPTAKVRIRVE